VFESYLRLFEYSFILFVTRLCVNVGAPHLLIVDRLLHLHYLVHADVALGEVVGETIVGKAAELEDLTRGRVGLGLQKRKNTYQYFARDN
jgi:hypothetical protein